MITRFIAILSASGYDDYQIYLLLSCAPVQGHVAGLVDVSGTALANVSNILISDQIPNACMTMGIPMDIFDFDISKQIKLVCSAVLGLTSRQAQPDPRQSSTWGRALMQASKKNVQQKPCHTRVEWQAKGEKSSAHS